MDILAKKKEFWDEFKLNESKWLKQYPAYRADLKKDPEGHQKRFIAEAKKRWEELLSSLEKGETKNPVIELIEGYWWGIKGLILKLDRSEFILTKDTNNFRYDADGKIVFGHRIKRDRFSSWQNNPAFAEFSGRVAKAGYEVENEVLAKALIDLKYAKATDEEIKTKLTEVIGG